MLQGLWLLSWGQCYELFSSPIPRASARPEMDVTC